MKKASAIKALTALLIVAFAGLSCDKDYTTLGTDIIGQDNYSTGSSVFPVIAYNKTIDAVQTNTLGNYHLGVYHDPLYGKTTSTILSQVVLSGTTSGINVQLDSVAFYVPYYSRLTIDANDVNTYILDSVYGPLDDSGNSLGTMKLSLYRSHYFMADFDADTDFEQAQKYFSNKMSSDGNTIALPDPNIDEPLFDSTVDLNTSGATPTPYFKNISAEAIELYAPSEEDPETKELSETLQPGIRLLMDTNFWQQTILDKIDDEELSNENNFKNYFRGIYMTLDELEGDGASALLNMNNAYIRLYYKSISGADTDEDGIPDTYDADANGDGALDDGKTDTDNDGITDEADIDQTGGTDSDNDGFDDAVVEYTSRTLDLRFSGNTVNFFDYDFTLNNGNETTGDEKLYLKGGAGSMAIVDLFNDPDELAALRDEYRAVNPEDPDNPEEYTYLKLINEANLVFYEDETIVTDEETDAQHDADRLFVYDLKYNIPLPDYYRDVLLAQTPLSSAINHLGLRTENINGQKRYKIRITEHVKNIIYKDSTSTKLGLTITSNVNAVNTGSVYGTTELDLATKIPIGSILAQRGTILYGNNTPDGTKQVQLEIFYTDPELDD